jgi:UDP-N-acetylglucosamine 2-epimerase (non-hydrolysing)
MKKIIVFLGTRPEAIKLAPVIAALQTSKKLNTIVCSTGQHKEMLQQVVDFFNIPIHYSLDVMEPNQQLTGLTAKLLIKITEVLVKEQPDMIVVQGDTTTTFTASLAAFYNKIKILHVEAGLRTHDKFYPFPEEMNRVMTTKIADYHYPPTEQSKRNLLNEGVPESRILVSGNTVIDALFLGLKNIGSNIPEGIKANNLDKVKDFILVTMHRRENHGEGARHICQAIRKIADDTRVPVVFPVHLNPNIKDEVYELLHGHELIHLTAPFAYPEFLWLMSNCRLILTDSGGLQEEAPSLGKPVLLLRDTTERPEAMDAGTVLKVGSNEELIYKEAVKLLTNKEAYEAMSAKSNPYGDGKAAQRILESIESML